MLPARFLLPWDVLEIYLLHDMENKSKDGDKFMLLVVARASKLILPFPLPSEMSDPVASNLLTLCLTFEVSQEIRRDAGGEFSSDVMTVPTRSGAVDHPQG